MAEKKKLTQEELDAIALKKSMDDYYKNKKNPPKTEQTPPQPVVPQQVKVNTPEDFQAKMTQETDPDLIIGYEEVSLPSKGIFYPDGLDTIKIEYLTSKDEDIMTTPSLIENGTVLDVILKRKIKTPNVDVTKLLSGDKSALLLFLRASSYGHDYEVQVTDPRTGAIFNEVVDLRKFTYKEMKEMPDELGEFSVQIPMRNKKVKIKLLNAGEEDAIVKQAETMKEAYQQEYSEHMTMKLKAHITEIDGNRDRSYISRFVDAMPARDSLVIRKKILDVTPEVNMYYEFTAPDGYKFKSLLMTGPDFFFPST